MSWIDRLIRRPKPVIVVAQCPVLFNGQAQCDNQLGHRGPHIHISGGALTGTQTYSYGADGVEVSYVERIH